jgi:hypothetical protein
VPGTGPSISSLFAVRMPDELIETFFFDRPDEPFGMSVRGRRQISRRMIRTPASCEHARTGSLHFASRSQIRTRYSHCQPSWGSRDLVRERLVGMRRSSEDLNPP